MLVEKNDLEQINNCINECELQERFSDKKIILFGCTRYARDIRESLLGIKRDIFAFVDNDKKKQGIICLDKKVFSPNELLLPHRDDVIIIVCTVYCIQMIAQLNELGYGEEQIIVIPISEGNRSVGDGEVAFISAIEDVNKGREVYQKLLSEHPDVEEVFLCPYPGTGDVYMACVFLPVYLTKHSITNYLLVVVGNNCNKVLDLFNIDNKEMISKSDSEYLLKAWEFYGDEEICMKPLLFWDWRLKSSINCQKCPHVSFADLFKYDVFELDEDDQMSIPLKQPITDEMKNLFSTNEWRKGRTVVLAPYAGSFVSEMTLDIWHVFSEELKRRGYDVCTNCYGTEKPVEGTKPIQFSYADGPGIIEYAGGFVGLRSGLCDILSPANDCKFAVIYELGFSATNMDFFGLKNMGLSKTAIELHFNDKIVDQLLELFPEIKG